MSQAPQHAGSDSAARSERSRRIAIAILGGVAVLFAALNFDDVKVDLLFGSVTMQLVVVIAFCLLLGGLIGSFLTRRRRS